MKVYKGTTRKCYLIGRYAIKIPKIWRWKIFLRGILANIDENWKSKHSPIEQKYNFAKVIWCSWWGLILVSQRAKHLTESEYNKEEIDKIFSVCKPLDNKIENFGKLENGRIVLVDYADSRYMCSDCEFNKMDKK